MNYDQICWEVLKALDSLNPVLSALPDSPERQHVADLRRDVKSGFYSIVLLGEFNRGKSTILNALLEQDLLPTDILPATAAIHVLRFSRDPALRVHWRDGRLESRELSAATLRDFTSVESADNLMHLELGVPSPILAKGVVFIDTPGVNDLNKQRAEVTYNFVPRSDAVVFVLDATAAVRRTEAEFLESSILASGIERIIFVANFSDLLDPDETAGMLSALRNRLTGALGGADRPIFLVSARQALEARLTCDEEMLKESGFPAFIAFLEELKTEGPHSIAKARQYARRAQAIADAIAVEIDRHSQLHDASDIALQQHVTALVRLRDAAQTRREKIGQWISDREREVLAIIDKSVNRFGEQLAEDIRDLIQEYSGPQFKQLLEERIPFIIKRRVKTWAESHTPAITRLLTQLRHELSAALEREFRRGIFISSCDRVPIEISLTAFSISADDVSGSHIKAGAFAAGAAGLLMIVGMAPLAARGKSPGRLNACPTMPPNCCRIIVAQAVSPANSGFHDFCHGLLAPLVSMVGIPFLQKAFLDEAKAKALPEITKALRLGMADFLEGLLNSVRAEIREIQSIAESAYDSQLALEQQRVEREMEQRQGEQREVEAGIDANRRHGILVKTIRQEMEALIHSISEEAVAT